MLPTTNEQQAAGQNAQQQQSHRRGVNIALLVLLFCVAAFVVVFIPVYVNKNNSSDSASSSSALVDDVLDDKNNENDASVSTDSDNTNGTNDNNSAALPGEGQQSQPDEDSQQTDGREQEDVMRAGFGTTIVGGTGGSAEHTVSIVNGPYNATLGVFTSSMTKGYANVSELEADLTNACWILLNGVIQDNINLSSSSSSSSYYRYDDWYNNESVSPRSADIGEDTNDYGTNNQEGNVEEGDLMVSDGTYVYAGFGDYLVAWLASDGSVVASIKMPGMNDTVQDDDDWYYNYGWYGEPSISNLIIYENRLAVTVSGYGYYYRAQRAQSDSDMIVMHDYRATHIRLYDLTAMQAGTADAAPELVAVRDVNGYFTGARGVGQNMHITTTTGIDTDSFIYQYDRWYYDGMSDDEYIAAVQQDAETEGIPKFVNALIHEMAIDDSGVLPNLARLTLFQTNTDSVPDMYYKGVLEALSEVFSFDMLADYSEDGTDPEDRLINATAAGSFMPGYGWTVYASDETLILMGSASDYVEETGVYVDTTYLLGLALDGATAAPSSVGMVNGTVMDSYSFDVVNGNQLRIATTINNWWRTWDYYYYDDEEGDEDDNNMDDSSTENYIIVLEIPAVNDTKANMTELGRIRLGKKDETFTAAKFFDDIAYATTFLYLDPLYAIDMTDPTNITELGSLDNITGFSEYLESMNEDNTLLLSIGQEATADGMSITGLNIVVYDATDPANLKQLQNLTIAHEDDRYVSSEALWDFKAIRFVEGHLFIPITKSGYWYYDDEERNDFHGYEVYEVSADNITLGCQIDHSDSLVTSDSDGDDQCYSCSSSWKTLPKRTMIFGGDVMTTQGPFVRSTDVNNCTRLWEIEITVEEEQCCDWFYW